MAGETNNKTLAAQHVEELKASGVSADFAMANGVYTETSVAALKKILGGRSLIRPKNLPALVFPYKDSLGESVLKRVKFRKPREFGKKKSPRSMSSRRRPPWSRTF